MGRLRRYFTDGIDVKDGECLVLPDSFLADICLDIQVFHTRNCSARETRRSTV